MTSHHENCWSFESVIVSCDWCDRCLRYMLSFFSGRNHRHHRNISQHHVYTSNCWYMTSVWTSLTLLASLTGSHAKTKMQLCVIDINVNFSSAFSVVNWGDWQISMLLPTWIWIELWVEDPPNYWPRYQTFWPEKAHLWNFLIHQTNQTQVVHPNKHT